MINDTQPSPRRMRDLFGPEADSRGAKVNALVAARVQFRAQRLSQPCERRLKLAAINIRRRHIDQARMAIEVGGLGGHPTWQPPNFWQDGVKAMPIIEI